MSRRLLPLLFLPWLLCGCHSRSPALIVGAAASLQDVLPRVTAPGVQVQYTFAASSLLVQQVLRGAPIDVLVTADLESQAPLQSAGRLAAGDPQTLFLNHVVVLTTPALAGRIHQVSDLARVPLRHLALCDVSVPIGHYARTALSDAGVAWQQLPVVTEPDVRAVVAVVDGGDAQAGLVYQTDVAAAHRAVVACEVPGLVARYGLSVLHQTPSSRMYAAALRSTRAASVFRQAGFTVPGTL